ncbi:MAG: tRNA (N(6)-L-threonylcarbamoyladenosine(37)-C(2))-methylthiotransferase MtaB [Bacteroidales bacterium]|nr:tRNA (N(6)-L-threonylcarbamoyladenosine(37)-C(2))-methylthiotransferase MtaB [Bacteroidales bacterium]
MNVAFVTLGCKLNYAETSTYERALLQGGAHIVPWNSSRAEAFVVNTCSVTEHSDKKSRNIIRKLHRSVPGAPIYVTGCSAELRRTEIEAIEGVKAVFGAGEKSLLAPTVLGQELPAQTGDIFPAYSSGERTRSFLKVQDGCTFKCNYCTVPYARGESRNIPICECVRQAREIAACGIKEIVLTGVNTGDFGRTTGESFLDLLKALDKVEGICRYRISSIEPNLLTEEIVDWIASGTKFLPHFHIPLQSGCDDVLHRMGRRYDTAAFAAKIDYIRSKMGTGVFFGIDVIVGFPGETDEDFESTCAFLRDRVKPAFIHVFPYSRRPGTPAAQYPNQVQDSVKTRRVAALEELCGDLHSAFVQSQKGTAHKVLFESRTAGGMMKGYTDNYIEVQRPYDKDKVGNIEEVIL